MEGVRRKVKVRGGISRGVGGRGRGGAGDPARARGQGGGRGRGRGRPEAGGERAQRRRAPNLSNEICTLVEHGLMLREAGRKG